MVIVVTLALILQLVACADLSLICFKNFFSVSLGVGRVMGRGWFRGFEKMELKRSGRQCGIMHKMEGGFCAKCQWTEWGCLWYDIGTEYKNGG